MHLIPSSNLFSRSTFVLLLLTTWMCVVALLLIIYYGQDKISCPTVDSFQSRHRKKQKKNFSTLQYPTSISDDPAFLISKVQLCLTSAQDMVTTCIQVIFFPIEVSLEINKGSPLCPSLHTASNQN